MILKVKFRTHSEPMDIPVSDLECHGSMVFFYRTPLPPDELRGCRSLAGLKIAYPVADIEWIEPV